MASPGVGAKLPLKMTDPRWPGSEGWVKMQQVIESGGREGPINVVLGPDFIARNLEGYAAMVELDPEQVERFWNRVGGRRT